MERRVGDLHEFELRVGIRSERRRREFRALFVHRTGAELVIRRPLDSTGECHVRLIFDFRGLVRDVTRRLNRDTREVECRRDSERERGLVESWITYGPTHRDLA